MEISMENVEIFMFMFITIEPVGSTYLYDIF